MVMDLSEKHEMVSDLFGKPRSPREWQQFQLTKDQVTSFDENGFVAGVQVLNDNQVDVLREELEGFFNADHEGRELWYEYHSNESTNLDTTLFHALGAWRIGKAFHDILWNPAIIVPASQLVGGAVRFWHDQLFCKPAGHGGVVAWHQDYSYWTRTKPMSHLTCWIGLDDATRDNGCLYYVPRSHKWPLLPITGLAGDMEAIKTVLNDEQRAEFKPIPIELKKGQAAFHHPLLVHGSYENRSDRPRRAAVLNFFKDGVVSDSEDVLLEGVPPIKKGDAMTGRFFPLLYDPQAK